MELEWVMGCGLGYFVGPKFLLCDGLGWVGSLVWRVELGWKKLNPWTTLICISCHNLLHDVIFWWPTMHPT